MKTIKIDNKFFVTHMIEGLNMETEVRPCVITMKDGSRMSNEHTTIARDNVNAKGYVYISPEHSPILYTLTEEEFANNDKFEWFDSYKDLCKEFCGMDDETWEEWNK